MPERTETPEEVFSALVNLGTAIQHQSEDFGAAQRSPRELAALAIDWAVEIICPRQEEILKLMRSPKADVASGVTEILLYASGVPVPGLPTIGKAIAEVGIEKFCDNPFGSLEQDVDVSKS